MVAGLPADTYRVEWDDSVIADPTAGAFGLFARWESWSDWVIRMPYIFSVALLTMIAASVWIKIRFSLRTLLIATTLLALVLGLIVWSMR
jgi:hypothetical protein